MKRLTIECTLLSDLIISSKAANEGFFKSLDYIPGSKFLGIVAQKLYDDQTALQRTLDLFHNGAVRFGDAHPLIEGKSSYRSPLSWHYPKKNKLTEGIFLYHQLDQECPKLEDPKENETSAEVLVQAKDKFFTLEKKFIEVDQIFSIKSAYDRTLYRSKDEQMYGYFALKKDTIWKAYIDFDDDQYVEQVKEHLLGRRRIGRSRTAQYGLVHIDLVEEQTLTAKPNYGQKAQEVYLYAYSNLCFLDENGNYTLRPDAKNLGLPAGSKVLWGKSQIRSRKYQSWNKKRHSPNQDRFIIQKGSVFAVGLDGPVDMQALQKGIGIYRSEGFGQVLLDPPFLLSDNEKLDWPLQKGKQDKRAAEATALTLNAHEQALLSFLTEKKNRVKISHQIDQTINRFIKDNKGLFKHITSSQWGQVRNIAKNAGTAANLDQLLFSEKFGFLYTGQSKNQWMKKDCAKKLQAFILSQRNNIQPEFTAKLASLMAKEAQKSQNLQTI